MLQLTLQAGGRCHSSGFQSREIFWAAHTNTFPVVLNTQSIFLVSLASKCSLGIFNALCYKGNRNLSLSDGGVGAYYPLNGILSEEGPRLPRWGHCMQGPFHNHFQYCYVWAFISKPRVLRLSVMLFLCECVCVCVWSSPQGPGSPAMWRPLTRGTHGGSVMPAVTVGSLIRLHLHSGTQDRSLRMRGNCRT